MAKLLTQTLVVSLSQMVKNSAEETPVLDSELIAQLEAVITELAGSGVMVEIEQA